MSEEFFPKIFGGDKSFVWPLILLFWTSGDVSSGFQSQSGQPDLCLIETPADLLVASMAAKLFSSMYLQAGIAGARSWDLADEHSTE